MHSTSLLLLLGAAGVVAILHSLLPDHWVPLAVVARTQRWGILSVIRVTFLASLGHVITSLVLAGIIALIGLQFQHEIETQQGHIVGIVLILTGMIFLVWGLLSQYPATDRENEKSQSHVPSSAKGNFKKIISSLSSTFALSHGHHHGKGHTHSHAHIFGHKHDEQHTHDDVHEHAHHDQHNHNHDHAHPHPHPHVSTTAQKQPLVKRLAAIAVPFGVAASPDLTILPVALAAGAIGAEAITSVLSVFALVTIGTFIGLTIIATLVGYQIKGEWLEKHSNTITSLTLIVIGLVAFIGF